MRFVVDVVPAGAGEVEGTVLREDLGKPMPFCGWLALLRLLEPGGSTDDVKASRTPHTQGLDTGGLG